MQVRVTASCNVGALAAAPGFVATEAGAWVAATPATCDAATGTAQLVLRCADCGGLSATSSLSFALPYSCQSILLEVGALDAAGAVSSFATAAAAPPGARLASITWALPTLLAVINSTVSTAASARGYTLTSVPAAVATAPLAPSCRGVAVAPAAAAVAVSISFQLATIYTQTTLAEKQSVTALLAAIVGVAGVFGLFGSLLAGLDVAGGIAARCATRRAARAGALVAAPGGGGKGGDAPGSTRMNPLRDAQPGAPADGGEAARGAPEWVSVTDGKQAWYRNTATGAVAWVLPAGAAAEPSGS